MAPAVPPETGQSWKAMPAPPSRAAVSSAALMPMVDRSMTLDVRRLLAAMISSATLATTGPSGRLRNTTSAAVATAAVLAAGSLCSGARSLVPAAS